MMRALGTLARRWIQVFVITACVAASLQAPATAQQSAGQAVTDAQRIARHLREGRIVDAIELAKQVAANASPAERQNAYEFAGWVCRVTGDFACLQDVVMMAIPHLQEATRMPGADRSSVRGYMLLLASYQVAIGDYETPARLLTPELIAKSTPAVSDPLMFAELQLIAAQRARRISDFEASRDHVDKALVATFSLAGKSRFQAARLLVGIIAQLAENYDTDRALRLLAAADPLLQTIPPDSFLSFEYMRLRADLMAYGRDYVGAATVLTIALAKLDRLQLDPARKLALQAFAYSDLLGLKVMSGPRNELSNLLASHPLMATKAEILARGYFANGAEFNFALAEEFVRLTIGDRSSTGWGDLMTMPPRWTKDPDEIRNVQAFGQAAIGFQLVKAGRKDEAKREFIGAAKKRLEHLREQYRASAYAAPLPRWADLTLADFAIEATLSGAKPDYDLIVQANALLSRTIATRADDALVSQAVQPTNDGRRTAQSLQAIQYQQATWDNAQVLALTKRVLSADDGDSEALARERLRILTVGNQFTQQLQRHRGALTAQGRGNPVDMVASLAAVQQSLLADEALVLHTSFFGHIGKVCIRADSVQSSTQPIDSTARNDARLLIAALTAAHPASNDTDIQYPAVQAVRIGKLLLGGLEDCLRRSPRVYVVASPDTVDQVPPAALLAEMPPAMGNGYDLRVAHWMIRDHAFVRSSSINEFVATKRLSSERSATLDYLGVADPLLATANIASTTGVASRGGLNSLQELPETNDEVQRVAALFDKSKIRLLQRQSATEEEFRLQPLSEFDVVHFATHGLIREELPGLAEPSLVFTPQPGGDILNDGLLTASQIAALPLRARLVVLSACNSARYQPSVIDSGIQGLSASFAIAGVPSMIAALWPIESTITRDLMVDTFRTARGGNVAIADAMAMAVRRHIDGPTPRPLLHPRFWAALVVVGDGAISLSASNPTVPRTLGPFAHVDARDHAAIMSTASLDSDFAVSAVGPWTGTEFESLIRREGIDGTIKWEAKNAQMGIGPITTAGPAIYIGGQERHPDGASTGVPVLRSMQSDGKILWTQGLQGLSEGAAIMRLAVGPDQSAVALVGPSLHQKAETDFSLVRIDSSGREIARKPLSLAVYGQGSNRGHLLFHGTAGLVVVNRGRWRSAPGNYRLNGMGFSDQCWEGDVADIVLIDAATLDARRSLRIERFEVVAVAATDDGWIVVGDARDTCTIEGHAAAYIVKGDGSVHQLWRDHSPFATTARGVRRTGDGFEIIGYGERAVAIAEDLPTQPLRYGMRRWGNEALVSGQLFSVRVSNQGVEEERDFVAAGLPVLPMGMTSTDARSVIFGTVGSRPLWLSR